MCTPEAAFSHPQTSLYYVHWACATPQIPSSFFLSLAGPTSSIYLFMRPPVRRFGHPFEVGDVLWVRPQTSNGRPFANPVCPLKGQGSLKVGAGLCLSPSPVLGRVVRALTFCDVLQLDAESLSLVLETCPDFWQRVAPHKPRSPTAQTVIHPSTPLSAGNRASASARDRPCHPPIRFPGMRQPLTRSASPSPYLPFLCVLPLGSRHGGLSSRWSPWLRRQRMG